MMQRILLPAMAVALLGGCVAVPFTAVEPGPISVADMQISPQST